MSVEDIGFWEGIRDVATGRGQLRLFLQPVIASIIGIRLGIADARERREPFVMRLIHSERYDRRTLAKEALERIIIPFCLAIVLDGVLQYLTLGYVRPLAAVVMGLLLIALPFLAARGFTNRIYRRTHPREHHPAAT